MKPMEKVKKIETSNKKTPLRMCISCREMFPQKELLRIVKTKDNAVMLAGDTKVNGRSAYCCRNKECIEKVISKHLIDKHFSMSTPDSVYEALKKEMN